MAGKNYELMYELLVKRIHESMEYHRGHEHDDAWSEQWHGFRADELSSLLAFCEGMESVCEDEQVAFFDSKRDELVEKTEIAVRERL